MKNQSENRGIFELLRGCSECADDLYGVMNNAIIDTDGLAHPQANTLLDCGLLLAYWMQRTADSDDTTGEGGEWLERNVGKELRHAERYYINDSWCVDRPDPFKDDVSAAEYFNVFFMARHVLMALPGDECVKTAHRDAIDAVGKAIDIITSEVCDVDGEDMESDKTEDAVNDAVKSIRHLQRVIKECAPRVVPEAVKRAVKEQDFADSFGEDDGKKDSE